MKEVVEKFSDLSNITKILKSSYSAIKRFDALKLKELSNQTVHSATIYQDSANIFVAVLVYSLSKIFQRESYRKLEGWDIFLDTLISNWERIIKVAETNDYKQVIQIAGEIRNNLSSIDGYLGNYIRDIFAKAEINKASKLYEHGISMEQTAKMLGVSLWDLSSYIGQSNINEMQFVESISEKERIEIAEEFFK